MKHLPIAALLLLALTPQAHAQARQPTGAGAFGRAAVSRTAGSRLTAPVATGGRSDDTNAPGHAGGGRVDPPCATVHACRQQIAWQRKDRAHLRRELAVHYSESESIAFQLAQAVYGMPASKARTIGTCESNLDPTERNAQTATGVMQELDSTFNRTPFARIRLAKPRRIASFDTFVNIMAAGYIWRQDGGSFREWSCSSITGVR